MHPSYADMEIANDLIEAIMSYHGYEASTHLFSTEEPIARKRKFVKVDDMYEEVEVDPNDKSEKKKKLSPIEQLILFSTGGRTLEAPPSGIAYYLQFCFKNSFRKCLSFIITDKKKAFSNIGSKQVLL